jgi:hypothetical protein
MNSSKVYSALRDHLKPAFAAAGFKRAKALLSWVRPQRDRHLVVWCQVSQDGWDDYAGSQFVVGFQLSDEPIVGALSIRRRRLGKLLNRTGREEMRLIQNEVISSLLRPPTSHQLPHISEGVRNYYLRRFEKVDQPYSEDDDIWCRYARNEHLGVWAKFILSKLPECFQQTDTWA